MIGSCLHHPAFAAPDEWPFSHDDCLAVRESIIAAHERAGYNPSPAYSYFTCQHGLILDGRTFARLSGANGTTQSNLLYWAYCALLPMGHQPSVPLLDALLFLVATAPGPGREVRPHNFFVATACPNPPLSAWIAAGTPAPGAVSQEEPFMKILEAVDDDPAFKGRLYLMTEFAVTHIGDPAFSDALVAAGVEKKHLLQIEIDRIGAQLAGQSRLVSVDAAAVRAAIDAAFAAHPALVAQVDVGAIADAVLNRLADRLAS